MFIKGNMSPTHCLHINQIIDIQKLMENQENKTEVINTKCDKVDLMHTNNGRSIVLKNNDYNNWWIKKDCNQQVKRLQTAYLQDIKIHR